MCVNINITFLICTGINQVCCNLYLNRLQLMVISNACHFLMSFASQTIEWSEQADRLIPPSPELIVSTSP